MLKDKITLLIHSCDKFSDLWDAHITLLNRNWAGREIRTILLTDAPTNKRYDGVEIISAGEGKEITERIRYVLPLITTEYVLVTLDDYFPTTIIQNASIERLVSIADKYQYDYIRLHPRPKCEMKATDDDGIFTYTLEGEYRVSLYVGVWRKSFMVNTLGDEELNAWQYEVSLTERARMVNGNCAMSKLNEFPTLDVVRKGRILHKAHRYLVKHDLYHGDRPVMPLLAEYKLWIITEGNRLLKRLTGRFYPAIKQQFMRIGFKSFSGGNRSK